ncbi:Rrf2 family transcriptional regulator [Telmatocola sphagniphila]|jgi:Rrf2 family protein|uniref:Rrf2 family transcriptional regulator n=1 Tax=Telmatocola sphagniphila TaxID=1123043 RepID=A0A8E6B666_9BACT|nr:Rrf2 family transcriptional regulator [Telmatocola sphagniphila]QVL31248.1 Rrf2 family transcriptional regulator [Telmatocola sphagniphila]
MRASFFSMKAEYACEAMMELAARHRDPTPIRLKTIADAHGIPKRFLVQILIQLKTGGLVESTRGSSGGYQLARDPDQISLADIIGVIERTEPAENSLDRNRSENSCKRVIHSLWNEITEAQQAILERTTLAELISRARAQDSLMYSI